MSVQTRSGKYIKTYFDYQEEANYFRSILEQISKDQLSHAVRLAKTALLVYPSDESYKEEVFHEA